jgi:hypothetical protein
MPPAGTLAAIGGLGTVGSLDWNALPGDTGEPEPMDPTPPVTCRCDRASPTTVDLQPLARLAGHAPSLG